MKLTPGKHTVKVIAAFFLNLMVWDIVFPTVAFGLTGGPSQPEVQSFEPVGTTEMVDVFSGDFVYNIPLLDVEGFPINISYHSGVGMDDEASWVGLGWNISPGAVNRNLRGIPDDFQGNPVRSTTNIKENKTYGITFNPDVEIFGKRAKFYNDPNNKEKNYYKDKGTKDTGNKLEIPSLDITLGIMYNTYRGLGYEFSLNPNLSLYNRESNTSIAGFGPTFSASSYTGADIDASGYYNYTTKIKSEDKGGNTYGFSSGFGVNSRQGLNGISFAYSQAKREKKPTRIKRGFSVNPMSYTPSIQHAMRNIAASGSFSLGPEILGWNLKLGIKGTFHTQYLKSQNSTSYAYGYMYSHDGRDSYNRSVNIMFDLNRENDGSFTKDKPMLPMPVYTYDIFNVSGEGTGGIIRPFRGDIGVMHDAEVKDNTVGIGLGGEIGLGNTAKWGVDINGSYGYSVSGPWKAGNKDFDIVKHLGFKTPAPGVAYEPCFFKSTGEKTLSNNDIYNAMLTDEPFNIEVANSLTGRLNSNLRGITGSLSNIKSDVKYENRQRRNMAISILDNNVARKMALDKEIKLFALNTFSIGEDRLMEFSSTIERKLDDNYDNLLSEMTVTNPDGRRYIYGIPAYNNTQYDVGFRVIDVKNPSSLTKDRSIGLVTFNAGDNSTGNGRGEDNYYNKTEIPAYAHSFLLSAILSSDYIDVTGNGVSDDDYGTAVKFNYSRVYSDYKWRTPFGRSIRQGNYDEGIKSDVYDDKANYIYGEKEVWYVHSIESKNYVACFYTSQRRDACQVLGEDGGIDASTSFHKLDSIKLFTKEELLQKGSNAVALKTVHFEYDYSLCPNTENNKYYDPDVTGIQANSGKLTLKKIYFTYQSSKKGRTNSYQFTYSDFNPSYNIRGYDRWANYKPNATKDECDNINDANKRLSNVDDPYVLQNKDSADKYSSAWSLTKIKLPSGGVIEVDYESDDYAFIQDKRAGQMFKITGINNDSVFSDASSKLYNELGSNNLYVFFDLVEPISKSLPDSIKEKRKGDYFRNIDNDKVYFKFLVDLTNKGDYDFVTGYADKHGVGFASKNPSDPDYNVGYVRLKEAPLKDRNTANKDNQINPITKASWNFMRLYAPKKLAKIFSNYEMPPASADFGGAARSLAGSINEMTNMFSGFGKTMVKKSAGQKFVFNKSFIRLTNPTKMKLGGGVRVKKVTLSDSWDEMVHGQEQATYGQKYDYTTEYLGETISSGVATWEPGIGGDENSHKLPLEYASSNALAPNDKFIIEKPVGESLFPAPSVGYSKVTTTNIKPTQNIKRTATGKVVNEFYTANDFPVIVRNTNIDRKPKSPKVENALFSLLKVYVRDRMYVSQGYSIELNDMHGKPKAQWVYEEGNEQPISGVTYQYNYSKNAWGQNQLISTVSLAKPDGSISSGEIGREVDYMMDTRRFYSFHISGGAQFNADAGFVGIIPFLTSTIFGNLTSQELEFGSTVNTKVIMRYGILKETAVWENGATVKTENVLYDSETGDVLLSKTTNEFNDTIYTFNYPAHYAYVGMEQAYKNLGLYFKNIQIFNGELKNLPGYLDYFVPGDELYIEKETWNASTNQRERVDINDEKAWAVTSPHDPDDLIFLTRAGNAYETRDKEAGKFFKYNIKILRSGRRNMPSASIGTVVSLKNPIVNGLLEFDSVINSGAVEFSDYWATKYTDLGFTCPDSCVVALLDSLFSPNIHPNLRDLPIGGQIELETNPYRENFHCASDMYNCYKCWPFYRSKHKIKKSAALGPTFSYIPNPDKNNLWLEDSDVKYASVSPLNAYDDKGPMVNTLTETFLRNKAGSPDRLTANKGATRSEAITCNDFNFTDCDSLIQFVQIDSITGDTCLFEICLQCVDTSFNTKTKIQKCSSYPFTFSTTWPNNIANLACEAKKTRALGRMYCTGEGEGECGKSLLLYPVNPYVLGIKGNWRPKRNWLFYNKRNQSTITDVRKDGTYNGYVDFWNKPGIAGEKWDTGTSINSKWTWNTVVTKFNRTGNEIENMDALNIYSSALFGYGNSIVKAVTNNAKNRQIAYDGFEDYSTLSVDEDHFSYYDYKSNLTDSVSHTGLYSIKVPANQSIFVTKGILYHESTSGCSPLSIVDYHDKDPENLYIIKPTEILEEFSPDTGSYIISCWVKENKEYSTTPKLQDSIFVAITVSSGSGAVYSFTPSGPVIEGWQRYEGKFTVPANATCITVILTAGDSTAYFDDLRIHPWQANMKSFVYHPQNLRLVAELDENNYATFYEYDDEGRLVRIKRETERGIVTLQESRTGLKIKE